MARPKPSDFVRVKRVVRFLRGVGKVPLCYRWQDEEEARSIKVFVDSDWAGCKTSRKSTSGGVLMVGKHVVRTWSVTQATIATSSGEAELGAMYEGVARGLGLQSIMKELGLRPTLGLMRVLTDSSVAKSFVSTRGLGNMRHVEVKLLWLQERVRLGEIKVEKVGGTVNVADALTKYQSANKLLELGLPHGIGGDDRGWRLEEGDLQVEGGCRHHPGKLVHERR